MLDSWESMSSDELFELHQMMQSVLREKLIAKKEWLEARMRQLNRPADDESKTDY